MTLFQTLSLVLLATLFLRDARALLRSEAQRRLLLGRCIVWLCAAAAIADPSIVQALAHALGVGRGADVIIYLFALAFLAVSFYFYARCVRLQRQISALVRHIALSEVSRGRVERMRDEG